MTDKPEVKVGQVWRETTKKGVRHVLVTQILDLPMDYERVVVARCNPDGGRIYSGRVSKMLTRSLQTRFELIVLRTEES